MQSSIPNPLASFSEEALNHDGYDDNVNAGEPETYAPVIVAGVINPEDMGYNNYPDVRLLNGTKLKDQRSTPRERAEQRKGRRTWP